MYIIKILILCCCFLANDRLTITSKFGCGGDSCSPTCLTIGRIINAETVWLTKVAKTRTRTPKMNKIAITGMSSMPLAIRCPIISSRPELSTANPRAMPPCAMVSPLVSIITSIASSNLPNVTTLHKKLLRSVLLSILVPNSSTKGIIAIVPLSPQNS